jgi:2-methylcitrate dehydratase PrpD
MTTALTAGLGQFISGLRFKDLPQQVLPTIRSGFTDCVGTMIAGAHDPAPQLLRSVLNPKGGEATLLLGEGRAAVAEAAWINSTAAHALDFDDVSQRGEHTSAVLVPAILAEAEALGASGEQMITAYAAGYETSAELVRRDPDYHHNKGWHPTGIFGAISTAAACASLHQLDAEQAARAIAIGASQSCGLTSNFGTMTKPFHAGRACHSGVIAARLAKAGFTASPDALEHPPGFLHAVSPSGRVDVESPVEAGRDWKLIRVGLNIKKYPLCFATNRALDGMSDLRRANKIDPAQVARISVSTGRRGTTLLRFHSPQTNLEARFSMEFAMAAMLIAGNAGLAELEESFIRRADVQALIKKVVVVPEDRDDPKAPGYAIYDQIIIEMNDGSRIDSGEIKQVRGGPDLPLTLDELWTKFEDCAKLGTLKIPPRRLFDALMSLDRMTHIREFPALAPR